MVKGENYVKIKKMINWKTEKRKLNELRPWERNPRQATEKQWQDLERSLEKFSLADPLIINKDNTIIGGHFRWKVLKEKGIEEVDVRVPDRQLSEKEVEELNVRLNKNLGEWDYDLLANFDEDLLKGIGFGDEELDEIFGIETADEFDVEEELEKVLAGKERRCKEGDLWQLGEHRLYIGDACKKESWEKVLGDEKVDMVFTDPPYASYGSATAVQNKIVDSKMIHPFIRLVWQYCAFFVKRFGHIYVFCDWRTYSDWYEEAKSIQLPVKNCIVWDKGEGGLGTSYQLCHEFILFLMNIPPKKTITGSISGIRKVMGKSNIWRFPREKKDRLISSAKPVELCKIGIENSSNRGEIVMDCFGGSGSTLIACEIMKRKCRMIEIEPIYGEVILARWEKFTGKKAELLRDF